MKNKIQKKRKMEIKYHVLYVYCQWIKKKKVSKSVI